MVWEESIRDHQSELPLKDTLNTAAEVGSIPSVQKDVLAQGLSHEQPIPVINKETKQPSQVRTKEQFKIAVENQKGELSNQLTELTETSSGTLAMELEEHIVELIEEKSKTQPYLYVSLKTTDSGHMLVGFDTENSVISATQRVTVRRTPSGTKLIDLHKDLIKKLKTTTSTETNNSNLSKYVHVPPNSTKTTTTPLNDSKKTEASRKTEKKEKRKDVIKDNKEVETVPDTQSDPLFVNKVDSLSKESKDISLTTLSWKSGASAVEKHSPPSGSRISPPGSSLKKTAIPNVVEPRKMMQIKEDDYVPPLIIIQTESQEADVNAKEDCVCPSPPITFNWKPGVFDRSPSLTQRETTETVNVQGKPKQLKVKVPGKASPQVKAPGKASPQVKAAGKASPQVKATGKSSPQVKVPEKASPQVKTPMHIQSRAPKNIQSKDYDCVCPRDVSPPCLKPAVTKKKAELNEEKVEPEEIKQDCECILQSPTSSFKSAISKSVTSLADADYLPELTELYKQGNVNVVVKVRSRNGIVRKLDTVVTRTLSGTLAIYGKGMAALGNISFDEDEYPVLLTKTVSDTYFVGIGQYDRTLNAVLRKTQSGGILVVPKSKSSPTESLHHSSSEEFYKIKVIGVRNYPVELPAVLKKTPSDNYVIVLDKEFEKRYKQTVQEFVGKKRECFVDLTRSYSGNYIIELETDDESHLMKRNALLVKSSSGQIKVLVHGPEFESMVISVSKRSSTSSSRAFGKLVRKLPASSREFHRERLRKSKFLDKKASSDTQLYEKVRMQLQENKGLLSEPSAVLKKTASGQYAIILNKESKKAFINNLQSYLTSNSQGLIPIKRTESGEIIIILNSRNEAKGRYGSLKITASGNIFVMVDEKTLKGITKDAKKDDATSVAIASSMATDPINPNSVNKSVTTTCNTKLKDCSCDPSKCVCPELQIQAADWFQDESAKNMCTIWSKAAVDANRKADNYCSIASGLKAKDKSPHIVIKPGCDCGPPTKEKFGSGKQCFYLLDTICPYHKDRYDSVSNEILEITGLCNRKQEELNRIKIKFNDLPTDDSSYHTWDSLNYLPPQLPPFLRNVSYR